MLSFVFNYDKKKLEKEHQIVIDILKCSVNLYRSTALAQINQFQEVLFDGKQLLLLPRTESNKAKFHYTM